MNQYLEETSILDFSNKNIQLLIQEKSWRCNEIDEQIKQVYEFVQNEILFGYNKKDQLKASEVLSDGYGQCNTKASLLMSLLRALDIPCRLHGFEVVKDFQKGALPTLVFYFAPKMIVHTWVEVELQGQWIALEGAIIDDEYLRVVQRLEKDSEILFKYAIATSSLHEPRVNWIGESTYIQKEAIVKDLGVYSNPDCFFTQHSQKMSRIQKFLYENIATKLMTRRVQRIRKK